MWTIVRRSGGVPAGYLGGPDHRFCRMKVSPPRSDVVAPLLAQLHRIASDLGETIFAPDFVKSTETPQTARLNDDVRRKIRHAQQSQRRRFVRFNVKLRSTDAR
jgi:hypothetical protein